MIGNSRKKNPTSLSSQSQSSPTKASVLIQTDCTEYVHELQARKESTEECLKLYKAKFEGKEPQKCIRHLDDFISLYCQQEKKLMCVNCLYGSTQHKSHNVIPLNTCWQSVEADNEEYLMFLNEECEKLKKTENELQSNHKALEKQYGIIIKEMEKEFAQIHQLIDQKHEELRQKAINWFSQSLKNTDVGLNEVTWRKNYFNGIRSSFPRKETSSHEGEIYKHLVMELLISESLDSEKLTYLASGEEMQEEFLHDARELQMLLDKNVHVDHIEPEKTHSKRRF